MSKLKAHSARERKSARQLARDAIAAVWLGDEARAEQIWARAKDAARRSAALQAYENGWRDGRRAAGTQRRA